MARKHTGRKFLLGSYSLLSASLLAAFGRMTAEYAAVVSSVMIAFSAADAYITGKTAGKGDNGITPGDSNG